MAAGTAPDAAIPYTDILKQGALGLRDACLLVTYTSARSLEIA